MTVRTKLFVWTMAGLFAPTALALGAWQAISRSLYQHEEARARQQADQIEAALRALESELLDLAGRHRPAPGQDHLGAIPASPDVALLLDGDGRLLDSAGEPGLWASGERPSIEQIAELRESGQWSGYYKTPDGRLVLAAAQTAGSGADDAGARTVILGCQLLRWLRDHPTGSQVYVAEVDSDDTVLACGPEALGIESLEALPTNGPVRTIGHLKLVRFLPLRDPHGQVLAHLAVVTERSWAQQMNLVGAVVGTSIFLVAVALAGMLLVGIHAYVLRPLGDLQTRVAQVQRRPEQARELLKLEAPEEIVRLAQVIAELVVHQQNAERALVESQALKSQFLANTSHELRTPLNAIVGFTQLIIDELYTDHDELMDFVSRAHRSALHLLGLVNDVLDLAKIDAGRFVLRMETIHVDEMFVEVEQFFAGKVTGKNIKLHFQGPTEPIEILVDPQRLRQVFFNVVGNAVKFTDRGRITIGCERGPEPGRVTFTVRDTGIGLRPEECERVFDTFAQADGRTTRQREGSGLGLTICRELLFGMGGQIWLHSAGPGTGCTVRFTVLQPGAAEPLPPAADTADATSAEQETC